MFFFSTGIIIFHIIEQYDVTHVVHLINHVEWCIIKRLILLSRNHAVISAFLQTFYRTHICILCFFFFFFFQIQL